MSSHPSRPHEILFLDHVRDDLSQGDLLLGPGFALWLGGDVHKRKCAPDQRGIVLSHDCDIDKGRTVLLAMVHPIGVIPAANQGNVRRRRVLNTFHLGVLPGGAGDETETANEDYFADIRQISWADKNAVAPLTRTHSLTDEARAALQRSVAKYFGVGR